MELDFEKENGLIPAIVQDAHERRSPDARLHESRGATTSRRKPASSLFTAARARSSGLKGETSGQKLLLRELRVDCDRDALLVRAELEGGAVCHEGYRSCFFREIGRDGEATVVAERVMSPEELYGKGEQDSNEPPETRHSQRQPAGFDRRALRESGLAHFREFAQLLSRHRRSRNRMHDGPRAGNGALRRKRRARRGPHRQRLDSRNRRGRAGSRRAGLFEDEPRPRPLGAGRRRRFAISRACATSKEK